MNYQLSDYNKIYFIGIKGVAMSGLAVICKQRGISVAGSDVPEKFITDKILLQENIAVFEGFASASIQDWQPDLVVIGTSWGPENPEVAYVISHKLPFISDSQLRGILSREKETVAVTGVHGKTTTTAMLAYVLQAAGLEPSFLIGTGLVKDLGGNARWSGGKQFIVEGDEYIGSRENGKPKFLDLDPVISIITSLEWEHVDVFKNLAAIESAFSQLIDQTKKTVVACGDWPSIKKIIKNKKNCITYGLEQQNQWQAYDIVHGFETTNFKIKERGVERGSFQISLFGEHNVLNSLAVIITAQQLGLTLERIATLITHFKGTERRFDVSEKDGLVFIDDYGHHPSEIKATLEAVRHRYPQKKIICVFQPHMASRTRALLDDFARSFSAADCVVLSDIFASARENDETIHSQDLVAATKKHHQNVVYGGDLNTTIQLLPQYMTADTVLVTMGAGDVYRVRDKLIEKGGLTRTGVSPGNS